MLLVYLSKLLLFKNKSNKQDSENNNLNSSNNSNYENNPNSGPEQDPEDEDFIKKTINNKNLITVNLKQIFIQKYLLNFIMLKSTQVSNI